MLNEQKWGKKLPDNEYDYFFFEYFPKYIMAARFFLHLDFYFSKKKIQVDIVNNLVVLVINFN